MTVPVVRRRPVLGGGFECECGHEFHYQASEVDGRPLWFHIAELGEGEQAVCTCAGCRDWRPSDPTPAGAGSDPRLRPGAGAA